MATRQTYRRISLLQLWLLCAVNCQPAVAKVVWKGDKVAVIVSDVTRLVRTAEFLPVIISEINAAGVPDEDITIIVATGTHRAHTHDEDIAVCGKDIVKGSKSISMTAGTTKS